ncbi:c-type cytochrome [Candidatus Sumerlaeota bacterium]|nr:c-type cytochrome [Candidatus Sumerlaeota bacterium]
MSSSQTLPCRPAWGFLTAICLLGALADPAGAQTPDRSAGADRNPIVRGKAIFEKTCSGCHGYDGEGQGELGFKLTSLKIRLATDAEIKDVLTFGNLTKGMPRFGPQFLEEGRLTDFGGFDEPLDLDAVVAYIRELQRQADAKQKNRETPPAAPRPSAEDDPARGEALFRNQAGCAVCHAVAGSGGKIGPDLKGLATRLSRDEIYGAIAAPSRKIAARFRMKELNLGRGRKVSGIYRNETSESIEIFDPKQERWKTYEKSGVLFYRPLKKSLMPDNLLGKLTGPEIGDLLAYLASLK